MLFARVGQRLWDEQKMKLKVLWKDWKPWNFLVCETHIMLKFQSSFSFSSRTFRLNEVFLKSSLPEDSNVTLEKRKVSPAAEIIKLKNATVAINHRLAMVSSGTRNTSGKNLRIVWCVGRVEKLHEPIFRHDDDVGWSINDENMKLWAICFPWVTRTLITACHCFKFCTVEIFDQSQRSFFHKIELKH